MKQQVDEAMCAQPGCDETAIWRGSLATGHCYACAKHKGEVQQLAGAGEMEKYEPGKTEDSFGFPEAEESGATALLRQVKEGWRGPEKLPDDGWGPVDYEDEGPRPNDDDWPEDIRNDEPGPDNFEDPEATAKADDSIRYVILAHGHSTTSKRGGGKKPLDITIGGRGARALYKMLVKKYGENAKVLLDEPNHVKARWMQDATSWAPFASLIRQEARREGFKFREDVASSGLGEEEPSTSGAGVLLHQAHEEAAKAPPLTDAYGHRYPRYGHDQTEGKDCPPDEKGAAPGSTAVAYQKTLEREHQAGMHAGMQTNPDCPLCMKHPTDEAREPRPLKQVGVGSLDETIGYVMWSDGCVYESAPDRLRGRSYGTYQEFVDKVQAGKLRATLVSEAFGDPNKPAFQPGHKVRIMAGSGMLSGQRGQVIPKFPWNQEDQSYHPPAPDDVPVQFDDGRRRYIPAQHLTMHDAPGPPSPGTSSMALPPKDPFPDPNEEPMEALARRFMHTKPQSQAAGLLVRARYAAHEAKGYQDADAVTGLHMLANHYMNAPDGGSPLRVVVNKNGCHILNDEAKPVAQFATLKAAVTGLRKAGFRSVKTERGEVWKWKDDSANNSSTLPKPGTSSGGKSSLPKPGGKSEGRSAAASLLRSVHEMGDDDLDDEGDSDPGFADYQAPPHPGRMVTTQRSRGKAMGVPMLASRIRKALDTAGEEPMPTPLRTVETLIRLFAEDDDLWHNFMATVNDATSGLPGEEEPGDDAPPDEPGEGEEEMGGDEAGGEVTGDEPLNFTSRTPSPRIPTATGDY